MTGMNGLELVMKLREINFPGMIAIVSSELNSDVEDEYRQLGIEKILNKPVELGPPAGPGPRGLRLKWSRLSGLNRRPSVYDTDALPLS
jgi:hypothetical protein